MKQYSRVKRINNSKQKFLVKIFIVLFTFIPVLVLTIYSFNDKIFNLTKPSAYGSVVSRPLFENALFLETFSSGSPYNTETWSSFNTNSNTYNLISSQSEIANGNQFLEIDYAANSIDLREIYSIGPADEVVFSLDFYDDPSINAEPSLNTGALLFGLDNSSGGSGAYMGIRKNNSQYIYRINNTTNSTTIQRYKGWHNLRYVKSPDGKLRFYLDDQLMFSTTYNISWNNFKIISSWNEFGKVRIDDAVIKVVPSNNNFKNHTLEILNDTLYTYGSSIIVKPNNASTDIGYLRFQANLLESSIGKKILSNKSSSNDYSEDIAYFNDLINDSPNNRWLDNAYINKWQKSIMLTSMLRSAYYLSPWLNNNSKDSLTNAVNNHVQYLKGQRYSNSQDQSNYNSGSPGPLTNNGTYSSSIDCEQQINANHFQCNTQAENNAWDAAFLASVANFMPSIKSSFDISSLDSLARSYAFNSLAKYSSDSNSLQKYPDNKPRYTIYSDFTLFNHKKPSPHYSNTVLNLLMQGALSYKLTGKLVPGEFYNNSVGTFNKMLSTIDRENVWLYLINGAHGTDWSGLNRTAFTGLANYFYITDIYGQTIPTPYTLNDYISQRRTAFPYLSSGYHRQGNINFNESFGSNTNQTNYYKSILNTHNSSSIVLASYIYQLDKQEIENNPILSRQLSYSNADSLVFTIAENNSNNTHELKNAGSGDNEYYEVKHKAGYIVLESDQYFNHDDRKVVSIDFKSMSSTGGKFLFGIAAKPSNSPAFYIGKLAGNNQARLRYDSPNSPSSNIDISMGSDGWANVWNSLKILLLHDKAYVYINDKFVQQLNAGDLFPTNQTGKVRIVFSWKDSSDNNIYTYQYKNAKIYSQ